MGQKTFEINSKTIGGNFVGFTSKNFKEIDAVSCFDYGVGYKYNWVFISETPNDFQMNGFAIKKIAIKETNGVIEDMMCFVRYKEFPRLLNAIQIEYGLPTTISSFNNGSGVPNEDFLHTEGKIDLAFLIANLKSYRNLGWHAVNTSLRDSRKTSMYLAHFPFQNAENGIYTAKIEFIVDKD